MDSFVKDKLTEWKLEKYIAIFEENEVDEEAMKCLTRDTIRDLIPKAGPQVKFLKYWTAEFENNNSEILDMQKNNKDIFDRSSELQCLQDVLCNVSHVSDFDHIAPSISEILPSTTILGDKIVDIGSAATNSTAVNSATSHDVSSCEFDTNSASSSYCSRLSDQTSIDEILRSTPEGIAVIRSYENISQLSPQNRLHLAGAIIASELKEAKDYIISSKRFVSLATEIVRRFPTEKIETYYIPYRLDKVANKKILAKGKLYDKYVSYRTLLRRNGAITTTLKRQNVECSRPLILAYREDLRRSSSETIEDCKQKIQWLKNCIEPWPTVEQYWKDSSKLRIDELSGSLDFTSADYFQTYRVLKQPLGHSLISIDFAQIYPQKTLALYSEWESLQSEILSYCQRKKKNDAQIKNLISLIPTIEIEDTGEEDRTVEVPPPEIPAAIVLRVLPLLLPCTTIKVGKKRAWRPSKVEVQNGFLLFVPNISHLDVELAARRRKLCEHGLTEQPLAVIVGESLLHIDDCYVCINEVKYKVQSPLDAIDIVFKSFYALQLQYPKEAELTWLTIQKRVYGIAGECDKIIPSVSTLIADLKNSPSVV